MSKLKISLVLDSHSFCLWQLNTIQRIIETKNEEIVSVIVVQQYINGASWPWKFFGFAFRLYSGLNKRISIPLKLLTLPTMQQPSNALTLDLSKQPIQQFFKQNKCDVLFNFCGIRILGGTSVKFNHGIWQLNILPINGNKSYPIAFHEVISNQKTVSFSLLCINQSEEGYPLREGTLKINPFSYRQNLEEVFKEISNFHSQALLDISDKIDLPNKRMVHSINSEKMFPSCKEIGQFLYCRCKNIFLQIWERGFFTDHWNVGYVEKPIASFLFSNSKSPVHWFPSSSNRFIADPFGFEKNGKKYVFFEVFEYLIGKGYISVASFENGFLLDEKVIIRESFHLSYPFVFEYQNNVYCVPETNEAGCIMLYKAESFPYQWKREAILVENFKGIDSTIRYHNGLWWMFTTRKADGPHHKLYLFYSEFLTGPWVQHNNNPVKIDIRSARGAGSPFVIDGQLYRPSQDYSEKIEGRICVNKIIRLTPFEFEEVEECIITPFTHSDFPHKTHNISTLGDFTLVDGCKKKFIFSSLAVAFFFIKIYIRVILNGIRKF